MALHKNYYVYVLKLEYGKVFVYTSLGKPIETIFLEASIYSDFLKVNKPVDLIEKTLLMDPYDVDKMVKYYMYYYGIMNVRGGSYTNIELLQESTKTITNELYYIEHPEKDKDTEIRYVIDQYNNIINGENFVLHQSIELIETNLQKYEKETRHLRKIKFFFSKKDKKKVAITDGLLDNVCWIQQLCEELHNTTVSTCSSRINSREPFIIIEKYKDILNIFKDVYRIYKEINPYYNPYTIHDNCVKHPELIFDDFIYNKHRIHLSNSWCDVVELCKIYKTFITTISNRIEEQQHDVDHWGHNYKWRTRQLVYLLNTRQGNI